MKDLIEKARQYILQEPQCKKDIFHKNADKKNTDC